jgi:hypothetical protein
MFHFFAHEFTGLGRRRQTFAFVLARPFNYFFFWHIKIVSPLTAPLDVTKTMSTWTEDTHTKKLPFRGGHQ